MKRETENLEVNRFLGGSSMDIKRVLTTVLGLPIIILIIVFGNNNIVDVFFSIVALIRYTRIFWSI